MTQYLLIQWDGWQPVYCWMWPNLPVTWHKWRIERALPSCLKMSNLIITNSRKRRARKKKLQPAPVDMEQSKKVCQFCLSEEDCEVNYGTIFEKEDVIVHYFCMLLSSGLCQNARVSDKKSILGFTLSDIKKEIHRGSRLKCCFCHHRGATIGCCVKTCRKVFHLSCGREHGTMHQFFDSFRSYCENHRLKQKLPKKKPGQWNPAKTCSICFCAVTSNASCDTLIPPCCQKSLFHRQCMQQYSLSAGMHYFKCPLCNSVEEFQMEMRTYGIYIPDQDASWEREPNAFEELLERHNRCDVSECACPEGRQFVTDSGKFELLLCGWCGAYGSHKACKGLVWRGIHLVCNDCAEIIDNAERKQKQEEREQEQLTSCRSRKRAFRQEELDKQSPTCSAGRRLKESPSVQQWQQNKNSPVGVRKRQRMNNLQLQSPAGLLGESDNRWRWTAESNSSSRQQSSGDNLQEERQSTGRRRGKPKHSEIAATHKQVEWDIRDCRVVLTRADREINNILENQLSWKNYSEMSRLQDGYTRMKPFSGKKARCKKSLTHILESCAGRFTVNRKQTALLEQANNLSTDNDRNTGEANTGSEESPPDLTYMLGFSQTAAGIFSDRSPPVIKPGICWEVSPQKAKARRRYCVTVSHLTDDSIGEILVAQDVYHLSEQMLSTDGNFQHVQAGDAHASGVTSDSAHKCGANELIKTAEPICSCKSTMLALRFQMCETLADKTSIQETVQQDSHSCPPSSPVFHSPPLLPKDEHHVDCNNQDTDRRTSAEKVTMTYLDKMLMQTDIFGKVVMLDSSHKRKRMSKSKDSTAFLRLSQSKIENFLITN